MKKTILIVEDEKSLSEAYKKILEKEKFKVVLACNGREALDCLDGIQPDAILLDLRMPVMNGLEFLKYYQAPKKNPPAIIIFSNMDNQKEIDQAYSLGASRYILKAWASPKELVKVVRESVI